MTSKVDSTYGSIKAGDLAMAPATRATTIGAKKITASAVRWDIQ